MAGYEVITFIIPVAPEHQDKVQRAIESVNNQTVPCQSITVLDTDRKGPAWARNQGVKRVQSGLISFLDADDELDPRYAERVLSVYKAGYYVYTDWKRGDYIFQTPDRICNANTDKYHSVTMLMSVKDFHKIGGFDESLPCCELLDFWMRARHEGICGIRCPYPLLTYNAGGLRISALNQESNVIIGQIKERYNIMGCCNPGEASTSPIGERQEGDVLVVMNWAGNRSHSGTVTGRSYPYNGNGKTGWISPEDQAAQPNKYILVVDDKGEPITQPLEEGVKVAYVEGEGANEDQNAVDARRHNAIMNEPLSSQLRRGAVNELSQQPAQPATFNESTSAFTEEDLSLMSKADLAGLASDYGLVLDPQKLNKSDMISQILALEFVVEGEAEDEGNG